MRAPAGGDLAHGQEHGVDDVGWGRVLAQEELRLDAVSYGVSLGAVAAVEDDQIDVAVIGHVEDLGDGLVEALLYALLVVLDAVHPLLAHKHWKCKGCELEIERERVATRYVRKSQQTFREKACLHQRE